jgi:hypothetical protein
MIRPLAAEIVLEPEGATVHMDDAEQGAIFYPLAMGGSFRVGAVDKEQYPYEVLIIMVQRVDSRYVPKGVSNEI